MGDGWGGAECDGEVAGAVLGEVAAGPGLLAFALRASVDKPGGWTHYG